jgi:cell division protease FtsH
VAKYETVDKNIDRSLDDFGRFLKHRWWLLLGLILIVWWLLANGVVTQLSGLTPGTLFGTVLQIAILLFTVILQFAAIFWFIGLLGDARRDGVRLCRL